MEEVDNNFENGSLHHDDYDMLIDHVVQDDHELLYLDTFLRECLSCNAAADEKHMSETL